MGAGLMPGSAGAEAKGLQAAGEALPPNGRWRDSKLKGPKAVLGCGAVAKLNGSSEPASWAGTGVMLADGAVNPLLLAAGVSEAIRASSLSSLLHTCSI